MPRASISLGACATPGELTLASRIVLISPHFTTKDTEVHEGILKIHALVFVSLVVHEFGTVAASIIILE